MLYVNLFHGEGALLEGEPQGLASIPVDLPGHEETLAGLIETPGASPLIGRGRGALTLPSR